MSWALSTYTLRGRYENIIIMSFHERTKKKIVNYITFFWDMAYYCVFLRMKLILRSTRLVKNRTVWAHFHHSTVYLADTVDTKLRKFINSKILKFSLSLKIGQTLIPIALLSVIYLKSYDNLNHLEYFRKLCFLVLNHNVKINFGLINWSIKV